MRPSLQIVSEPIKFKTIKTSPWYEAWRKLKKQHSAMFGLGIVVFIILIGLFAPVIAPEPFDGFNTEKTLISPNQDHWFGTDDQGRDILSRVLYGARISIGVGFFSVTVSIIV